MIRIVNPRCEYKKNPLGIDVQSPRISWQLASEARGILQAAYRIQVSKEETFETCVWDSRKVDSDQSLHVEYSGEPLQSRTRYFYRIKSWDNKGHESEWSAAAYWETGLLKSSDWQARWITPQNTVNASELTECPYLRKEFHTKGKIKSARIYSTALGLYELHINGAIADDTLFAPGWTSYRHRLQYQTYDVTGLLANGKNALGAVLGNGWYKGNLAWVKQKCIYGEKLALLLQLNITYENGEEEVITSDAGWKTSTGPILVSEIYHGETYDARLEMDGWNTAGFDDGAWAEASLLEYGGGLVAQENVPDRTV